MPAMPYRVKCHLVLANDEHGFVHHHYEGAIINWLNDRQRTHWLANGLVEEIGQPQIEAIELVEQQHQLRVHEAEAERIRQCLDVLDELDVPLHKGRPAVRAALESRGHKFSNETIAAAIKERRELSRTPGMPASPMSDEMA
jgi:hypothetical protein